MLFDCQIENALAGLLWVNWHHADVLNIIIIIIIIIVIICNIVSIVHVYKGKKPGYLI